LFCFQILQQKFDDFQHELSTSEDRVTNLHSKAEVMIEAHHYEVTKISVRDVTKISVRDVEVMQMWADLKEVTTARQDVSMIKVFGTRNENPQ